MKSMKIDKAAREAQYKEGPKVDAPEYPYDLRLTLNHEVMKALGIDKLPEVGTYVTIHARCCVQSVEERDDIYMTGETKRRSMQVQIEDMAIEAEAEKA